MAYRIATTDTVWDKIKPTQALNIGSSIPKSFELTVGNSKYWVNPNATKHMVEYANRTLSHGKSLTEQQLLSSFEGAMTQMISKGYVYDVAQRIGNWEIVISAPRSAGLLPVVKHAVYIP